MPSYLWGVKDPADHVWINQVDAASQLWLKVTYALAQALIRHMLKWGRSLCVAKPDGLPLTLDIFCRFTIVDNDITYQFHFWQLLFAAIIGFLFEGPLTIAQQMSNVRIIYILKGYTVG